MVPFASKQRTMVVDMVPMVNIVFLLLIFFMLSGQLRTPALDSEDAPMTLLEHEPVPKAQEDRVVLIIDEDGRVRVGERTLMTQQEVQAFVPTLTARERILSAHRDAPSGAVHQLLRALQQHPQARTLLLVVHGAPEG
ncbi:MAG: biopolymer transporter ExbD [Alphaproteobacteria bacterium GM202ARS2]|nr:biopolymer transporter ExbD [Alphaproteobacteria bacterium GM202ARS2]